MWNWPISFVGDSYSFMALCSVYNVAYATQETSASSLNSNLAIIILILLVIYPLALQLYLYRIRRSLLDKKMHISRRFLAAHKDLDI